jgi:soluble lytic murein transglycosylase-like protein
MTSRKRLWMAASALACSAAVAFAAAAEAPRPLSDADAQHYAAAFDATDRGDFIDAQMQAGDIKDKSLAGYLSFRELMHPSAHTASFQELSGWLARFRDLPLAGRVFSMATRRRPADAEAPPRPLLILSDPPQARAAPDRGRAARQAFYSGDARRALVLARQAGEGWIAGLAAYRLNDYAAAQASFRQVADDTGQDGWLRSAGAYWAARSATALGDSAGSLALLRQAAGYSETFYGMIAERQVHMLVGSTAPKDSLGQLILTSYAGPTPDLRVFVQANSAAHRAAALAQLGRADEARQELRAGIARAETPQDHDNWTALLASLAEALAHPSSAPDTYPTPTLEPRAGFTIDKALVYAIVRQESRFNPLAISPVGAVGLMQLMPEAAARAAGDDKLRADMRPLFDPSFNLRVGQDYVSWLMERGVGYDILRTVAAYNGGPGMLAKTSQMLGGDADSLMVIECLPAQETRDYVRKVMAGYWGYKRLWGEDARTLDALAAGARFVDARLDLPETRDRSTKTATQALQLGMR